MVGARLCAAGIGVLAMAALGWEGPAKVSLREAVTSGSATKFIIELKAEGVSRPGAPGSAAKQADTKALALKVETRFAAEERVLQVDAQGRAQKVLRRAIQAAAAINGEVKPTASALRPEETLLSAELRNGAVVSYSFGGPLMRSELELVEGPGDPLALPWLLPEKDVAVGDHWQVGTPAARVLSSYDALAANALEATLESVDEARARIKLTGQIRGAALGGEGTIQCEGSLVFDRKAKRVTRLELTRKETRKPGPVEAGLEIKSTLTVERTPIDLPAELGDAVLSSLPTEPQRGLEELLYEAPDGKYSMRHDRDWHIFAEDSRRVVLKRLDHGELVAQCNLVVGPNAGPGRHQDLDQFRADIRRALGQRFVKILEAGEVEAPGDGSFRYRVAVQGHEGDVGILWYYYLVASAGGDQLLFAFTVGQAQAQQFAEQDLRLVGSLEWKAPDSSKPNIPPPSSP